jgi:hypothetical protein
LRRKLQREAVVKSSGLTIAVCVCAFASEAHALDWSLNSTLSERTELSDNAFLSPKPIGATLGTFSTITGDATARTPTSRFSLDGDITYTKYLLPGAEATQSTEAISEGIAARFENLHKSNTDKDYIEGSWRRQNLALALLNQTGLPVNVTGDVDIFTARGGFERSLSAVDLVTLSARAASTSYQPTGAGTPFTDVEALGTWKHRVSSIADINAASEYERLSYDDIAKTNLTMLRETAGVRAQLSQRLSFSGSAGITIFQASQNATIGIQANQNATIGSPIAGVGFPTVIPGVSGTAHGFIGNAVLTYKLLKDTNVSFAFNKTVAPSIVGSLLQSTTYDMNLVYMINHSSSLSFSTDFSQQTSQGAETNFLSTSISYNKQLAREWNAQLTYRFLHRSASSASTGGLSFDPITGIPIANTSTAPANSNTIIVALSHGITVLPGGQ